jgi:hypothetical protein
MRWGRGWGREVGRVCKRGGEGRPASAKTWMSTGRRKSFSTWYALMYSVVVTKEGRLLRTREECFFATSEERSVSCYGRLLATSLRIFQGNLLPVLVDRRVEVWWEEGVRYFLFPELVEEEEVEVVVVVVEVVFEVEVEDGDEDTSVRAGLRGLIDTEAAWVPLEGAKVERTEKGSERSVLSSNTAHLLLSLLKLEDARD